MGKEKSFLTLSFSWIGEGRPFKWIGESYPFDWGLYEFGDEIMARVKAAEAYTATWWDGQKQGIKKKPKKKAKKRSKKKVSSKRK